MTTIEERGPQSPARLIEAVRHDLATPLAVARGSIDHLRQEPSDLSPERRAEILAALDRSIAALERLSANLRSDARLVHPGVRDDFGEIRVRDLVDVVRSDLRELAGQRAVKLEVHMEPSVPDTIEGAFLLVRQALENLVTNAIKHSPRESAVTITCRRGEGNVRFEVSDRGPGLAPSEQTHLFDRSSVSSAGVGSRLGVGIGLSIVKRVADVHDGQVGVSSQAGDGSTFWISFPIAH